MWSVCGVDIVSAGSPCCKVTFFPLSIWRERCTLFPLKLLPVDFSIHRRFLWKQLLLWASDSDFSVPSFVLLLLLLHWWMRSVIYLCRYVLMAIYFNLCYLFCFSGCSSFSHLLLTGVRLAPLTFYYGHRPLSLCL